MANVASTAQATTLSPVKAKKSFGQHFLAQPEIARQIAYSVQYADIEQVLEVGPGQGMLTQFLLQRDRPVFAVEADHDMVSQLQGTYPQWAEDHLISEDFLKFDLKQITQKETTDGETVIIPTALVGNFPYNISSQILVKLVDNREYFPRLVGMFQRELAERVLAPPGSKTYGSISVLVQAFYAGSIVLHVKPGSFNPPPKVNSTVIALERLPANQRPDCDEEVFRRIVRTAFQQRRKMLRNSLKQIWPGEIDPDDPSLQRRPEQLSVEEFAALARRVSA